MSMKVLNDDQIQAALDCAVGAGALIECSVHPYFFRGESAGGTAFDIYLTMKRQYAAVFPSDNEAEAAIWQVLNLYPKTSCAWCDEARDGK
jgi:hypothetical protein